MKREKLITRTVITTLVNFKYFDCDSNTVKDSYTSLIGKLSAKDVEEEIKASFENDKHFGFNNKFIMVNSISYNEKLYGVTETAFLEIAKELPPRKNNETQEDD